MDLDLRVFHDEARPDEGNRDAGIEADRDDAARVLEPAEELTGRYERGRRAGSGDPRRLAPDLIQCHASAGPRLEGTDREREGAEIDARSGATEFRAKCTAAGLAAQLAGIEGRFLLSLNDHPEVRRIFAGFTIDDEAVRYTLGGMGKSREFGELIISN